MLIVHLHQPPFPWFLTAIDNRFGGFQDYSDDIRASDLQQLKALYVVPCYLISCYHQGLIRELKILFVSKKRTNNPIKHHQTTQAEEQKRKNTNANGQYRTVSFMHLNI